MWLFLAIYASWVLSGWEQSFACSFMWPTYLHFLSVVQSSKSTLSSSYLMLFSSPKEKKKKSYIQLQLKLWCSLNAVSITFHILSD